MKAYQAERKFLYFEKRHFLFFYPEWVSCVCAALIRKREEVERWKRELISNQIQKLLDIFQITTTMKSYANCVCPASVRAVPFQRAFCRILTLWDFGLGCFRKLCSKIILNPQQNSNKTHFLESSDMCVWVIVNIRWLWWDCDCETRLGQSSVEDWPVAQSEYWSQGIVGVAKSCRSGGRYIWAVFFTAGAIKSLAINRNTDPKEYVLSVLWESTKYSRNPFRVCEGFFS